MILSSLTSRLEKSYLQTECKVMERMKEKTFTLQEDLIFEKARSIMKNLCCNKKNTFLPFF